jgi:hypothetical protein
MACAMLLAGVAVASARGERELTEAELRSEMSKNTALAAYVRRNGDPDYAESHFLSDLPPWDDHEVALYYLDARKEIAFARAWILGRPEIHVERYERPLTDEQIAALATRSRTGRSSGHAAEAPRMSAPEPADDAPRVTPAAHVVEEPAPATPVAETAPLGPDERAEAAARRAEDAAARLELAADSAEHAADRAEAVSNRAETDFHSGLRK